MVPEIKDLDHNENILTAYRKTLWFSPGFEKNLGNSKLTTKNISALNVDTEYSRCGLGMI